jgi:TPR repeat protein
MVLLAGISHRRDLAQAIEYFELSAEHGSADGQMVVGWMSEKGIGMKMNVIPSIDNYEMSSDFSPYGAALCGRSYQTGRRVPINFTIAAELFQKSAEFGNADAANNFGCCLECGEGVDKDIEEAVVYYRKSADEFHRSGLYNLGRCVEYGKGTAQDFIYAAKCYRLAADMENPMAENSFGVCLERGIGVFSNPPLAARYYQRAAAHGDPDGANNLGFCLEHGRGVKQNIESAAKSYQFARDHGHPEAAENYRRCLRILGHWDGSDRSEIIDKSHSDDHFAKLFIDCLDDGDENSELITSIERFKNMEFRMILD